MMSGLEYVSTMLRRGTWQFLGPAAICWLSAAIAGAQSADAWRAAYDGKEATGAHVVGLWHFDQGDETSDASGRNAAAVLHGAVIAEEGRFAGCLESFPGWPVENKRHAAVVPNRPELSPRGAFTIEMWLRAKPELAAYKGNPFLVDKKYVAQTDYQLILGSPAKDGARSVRLSLGFGGDSETWTSDPIQLTPDRWHHLAVTYDAAGTARFFLDGAPRGGGTKAGRGGIAAGTHPLSIGDRLGSNYAGFPGYLDEVRISSGVREFRTAPVFDASRRRTFLRGEAGAQLRYRVTNALSRPLQAAQVVVSITGVPTAAAPAKAVELPTLEPGGEFLIDYDFPTGLRPASYQVSVRVDVPGEHAYQGQQQFPVQLVARPLPHRLPVVMWGIGGIENVTRELPRLKRIGFTHCLGLSADYSTIYRAGRPMPATSDQRLAEADRMLDEALAGDLRIVVSLSPGRWLAEKPEWQRVDRNGKPYPRHNLANNSPDLEKYFYNVGASVAQTWGDHPALAAALINTEIRDGTSVSFHERERAAFRQHAGFDIPQVVARPRGVDYQRLADFPADRIIADDHPVRVFCHWFWKEGDGWNGWHSAVHRGFHSTGRNDLWTFFDPAVRVPSVWGSGGQVDYLSHWTYSYPDPLRIGLCADELLAMAGGRPGQRIMKMTQLIWYRSQTAPAGQPTDQAARSPWEDYDPDADYITIAPLHLREALWTKLARPVQGIMYHGWQSLVPSDAKSAYRHTHPETQHELTRLVREVVRPLGPTLMQVPAAPADVALLESFTSQMFAGRGTYGWGHSWTADMWLVLQHAHLQADVVYEETILRDGLDRFRVLVLPDCDVLPRSVAERIVAFQRGGGIVIGDDRLAPGIKPDILVTPVTRTKRADESKAALLAAAASLRGELDRRYDRYVDTSDPEVVPHVRRFGRGDYVFVVNDQREFGSYVGQHGLVMEHGLPSSAEVSLRRDAGHVYDLRAARPVELRATGAGRLTWPVHLAPAAGGLFLITQRPIERLAIEAPDSAAVGRAVNVKIAVTDRNRQPIDAVVPLHVEIRDPDGRPAEFSGFYGAAGGQLRLTLEFAPNDVPGLWHIHTRDLAAGLTSDAYIRLGP